MYNNQNTYSLTQVPARFYGCILQLSCIATPAPALQLLLTLVGTTGNQVLAHSSLSGGGTLLGLCLLPKDRFYRGFFSAFITEVNNLRGCSTSHAATTHTHHTHTHLPGLMHENSCSWPKVGQIFSSC